MSSSPFANNNPRLDAAIVLERLRAELGRVLSKSAAAPTTATTQALANPTTSSRRVRSKLAQTPIIGPLALWALSALRLQRTRADLRQAQDSVMEALTTAQAVRDVINQQGEKLNRGLEGAEARSVDLSRRLEEAEAGSADLSRRLEGTAADLSRRLDLLAAEIAFQQSRLAQRLERKAEPERVPSVESHRRPLAPGALDSLFLQFEDAFRGSREDIKARVRVHLERIALTGAGATDRVILDLGCGRGEWLEVLRQEGLSGRGVDLNACNVELCRRLGLEVEQAEAIDTLRSCPDSSLGGVTAFHLVEHLPLEEVVVLLDEALRTVMSGGVLLLETPNPENLMVGAKTFFFDPTHRHPIPPQVLSLIVQHRGFTEVEIIRLHPYPQSYHLDPKLGKAEQLLNDVMFGPQDYALIARKP